MKTMLNFVFLRYDKKLTLIILNDNCTFYLVIYIFIKYVQFVGIILYFSL